MLLRRGEAQRVFLFSKESLESFASRAVDKKTAQQRAALKLLKRFFPELLHLVEDGPWNTERPGASFEEKSEGGAVDLAEAFRETALKLRATTPSNTLNNLCLVSLTPLPLYVRRPARFDILLSKELMHCVSNFLLGSVAQPTYLLRKQRWWAVDYKH